MDSESERIFDRMRLHRLLAQEPERSSQSLAEALGKSEGWVCKWRSRFASTTVKTFKMFMSQSRVPKHIWRETSLEVKAIIGQMRVELSEQYHRRAGPKLILYELRKREDLRDAGHYLPQSERTIGTILKELGYIEPKYKRHRQPLVLPAANDEWEMDFGQIRLDEATIFEFFVVLDRGTSRVIYLGGSEGYNAETALEAVARLLLSQGMPRRLRFDRDSRFVGSWTRDSYPSPLLRFLRVVGVKPVVCPPYRPDLKPFAESNLATIECFSHLSNALFHIWL